MSEKVNLCIYEGICVNMFKVLLFLFFLVLTYKTVFIYTCKQSKDMETVNFSHCRNPLILFHTLPTDKDKVFDFDDLGHSVGFMLLFHMIV